MVNIVYLIVILLDILPGVPENLHLKTAGWLSLTVASFKGSMHSGAFTFLSVFFGPPDFAFGKGAAKNNNKLMLNSSGCPIFILILQQGT